MITPAVANAINPRRFMVSPSVTFGNIRSKLTANSMPFPVSLAPQKHRPEIPGARSAEVQRDQ
jgi:hypothetical protein